MAITLCSEGAAREVTGSKHVLSIDNHRILIDCGAFQGKRKETDEKNRALVKDPSGIDAVILTHGHYDHCGLLPLLVKRGFSGNIICTPATRDLANIVMLDSARIQASDALFLGKQAAKKGEQFAWKPLYDELDVIKTTGQFLTVNYNRPFIVFDGVKMEFRDAGHILGSALVMLDITEANGRALRIGFSGDLGRNDKPIIRDPEPMKPVEYLVLESTYGNRLHEKVDDALIKLADIVNSTVKKGGKIIIPAFAIERTQELIFYFHLLIDDKKIPSIPIYVDSPMAINATSIFQVHPECYDQETYDAFMVHHKNPFGFNELHFASSVEESKNINSVKEPAIIISADGMCEAGRILHHLANTIQDSKNTVLLVGFMAADTLGRRLMDGQKEVRILGDTYKVQARIEQIHAFSAHADYEETWTWLEKMDRSMLKKVFLVHGEDDALQYLQNYLLEKGIPDVEIVEPGISYQL